jgi:TonB family protein
MLVYGLRLLVALITFGVGAGAAWLFNFESPKRFEKVITTDSVLVTTVLTQDESHPRSCNLKPRRIISGGILDGKAISKPAPVYPPAAKAAGVGGTVAVQIVVDEVGNVETAEAVSGPALLRDAAETAALRARFSPTLLSGQPLKVSGVITYNFGLE